MDQIHAQLLKEKKAFADAQQIMNDFNKFLYNGGLDVVGANAYDRQLCYDKYESLDVMLKARQNELYHRRWESVTTATAALEDVELNLTILHDLILNAVYYMVPNNETRKVKNSGKINFLCSRDPSALYDPRYHNQNIPQWLNSLPQYLFESYDHAVAPPSSNMNGMPSHSIPGPEIYTPQSKRQLTLSAKPIHEQNHIQPQQSQDTKERRNVQVPKKKLDEYRDLSHRNRSAYYRSMSNGPGKLQNGARWFSFCGCGRRASGYS